MLLGKSFADKLYRNKVHFYLATRPDLELRVLWLYLQGRSQTSVYQRCDSKAHLQFRHSCILCWYWISGLLTWLDYGLIFGLSFGAAEKPWIVWFVWLAHIWSISLLRDSYWQCSHSFRLAATNKPNMTAEHSKDIPREVLLLFYFNNDTPFTTECYHSHAIL